LTEPIIIGTAGVKFVKDANTKMMTLNKPTTSGTTESLHTSLGVDYQVPVGKKFIILKIFTGGGFNGSVTAAGSRDYEFIARLYTNTITDSTVGAVLTFTQNGGIEKYQQAALYTSMAATSSNVTADVYIEVAAGDFIIANITSNLSVNVSGIETDV
jgi:hypothetical protein